MIESRKNRILKDIRRLRRCKGDRAVLEGPHLLREALDAGIPIETVLATPDVLESSSGDLASRLPIEPLLVTAKALESVTDSDSPRGWLAVAELPRPGVEALPHHPSGIYVHVVGVQDPGNLGAIARAAEASGASGLALSPGCAHPNHPRSLRASAGSLLRLPTALGVETNDLRQRLASLQPFWVALSPAGDQELWSTRFDPPVVLVVGSERGLDAELEASCELRIRVPMAAPVESLNTAVAAALVLFEIRRQSTRPASRPVSPD